MLKRGATLIQVVAFIIIVAMISASTAIYILSSSKKANQLSFDSEKQIIKTACLNYEQETATLPLVTTDKPNKTGYVSDSIEPEVQDFVTRLYRYVYKEEIATGTHISDFQERFRWIDSEKLMRNKDLEKLPADDRYVMDIESGVVFHVKDDDETISSYALLLEGITSDKTSINSLGVKKFGIITSDGMIMTRMLTVVNIGNTLFVGGTSTSPSPCYLAKVSTSKTGVIITDLSSSLVNPSVVNKITKEVNGLKVEYKDLSGNIKYITLNSY